MDSSVKRPYMHTRQDDNLVVQGINYIDILSKRKRKASFIVTRKIFKNDKLYYDGPAMIVGLQEYFTE